MSISVVITTYGEDRWRDLAWSRAYPSAEQQQPLELICHHEPDLTIGPARNRAALQATTDWLLFLDADDELEPGYIQAMRDMIWRPEVGTLSLFQPAVRWVKRGRPGRAYVIAEKDLSSDNYLVIGTLIHNRLFRAVGGFSDYPHGFEDWSLWAKAWKAGARVTPVPTAIYRAYVDPTSKHKQGWKDRKQQVATHQRVQRELFPA